MDRGAARSALIDRARAFGEVVRAAPDPERRVEKSNWNVRQVAAHLVVSSESYVRYVSGDSTPVVDLYDLATTSSQAIAQIEESDVAELAHRTENATARFVELTEARALDERIPLHGVETTLGAMYGIFLCELVLHGQDIARTFRRTWRIERGHASMILESASKLAHVFVDRAHSKPDAAFEIRLRGGPAWVFRFAGGSVERTEGRARDVDCRVSADPVAMLQVFYGRESQWPAILRGRLVAFGRKPWLAFGLSKRFSGF